MFNKRTPEELIRRTVILNLSDISSAPEFSLILANRWAEIEKLPVFFYEKLKLRHSLYAGKREKRFKETTFSAAKSEYLSN